MITRLVLFGATGDLAGRFLFPALARAIDAGELPSDLAVVGAAPQDWDDETFAAQVAQRLTAHAGNVSGDVRDALVSRLQYRRVNLDDPATVARAVDGLTAVALYLALPPTLFSSAVAALATAELPAGSRIAVEKPFGRDLAGAIALNSSLAQVIGGNTEAVFRVDHALAMPGVQDLQARRSAALERGAWDSDSLEQVDVLWEETIGLEGRADFFDRTGVVRDVIQNHLLQILALVAMELAPTSSETDLAPGQARRPALGPRACPRRTRVTDLPCPVHRRRAGRRKRHDGPGLRRRAGGRAEPPHRDVSRAAPGDRKGVLLHLRDGGQVWIGMDGSPPADEPTAVAGELVAYGRVLVDVLSGGIRLSVSADEAEVTWQITEPVLDAWAHGASPLSEYRAGSIGPVVAARA